MQGLQKHLLLKGKNEKAVEVLDRCLEMLPVDKFPYDPYYADLIEAYFAAGKAEKQLK